LASRVLDHRWSDVVVHREARAVDQHIERAQLAVLGHDARGLDAGDGVGHQLHVRPRQRGVVVVGDEDPLTTHAIVRREAGAEHRIGDLRLEVLAGDPLGQALDPGPAQEGDRAILLGSVDERAVEAGHHGVLERASLPGAEGAVGLGDDPWRRALKERQAPAAAATGGTSWIALAPVPITPTRRPSSGTSWRQPAE
jgi:hypothetical protein